MNISKQEVQHIAKLVRLRLNEAETKKYQKQLGKILDYVGQLKKVKTKDVNPCTGGMNLVNVFRSDEPVSRNKEEAEKLIQAAPQQEKGLIKTKKIFYEPR